MARSVSLGRHVVGLVTLVLPSLGEHVLLQPNDAGYAAISRYACRWQSTIYYSRTHSGRCAVGIQEQSGVQPASPEGDFPLPSRQLTSQASYGRVVGW